jgi:hypothetical protein
MLRRVVPLAALALALVPPAAAQEHEHGHGMDPNAKLGAVHFETTCSAAVGKDFDRAVALLHSFEFALSIDAFRGVLQQDPSCGIAAWGIALSSWSNPFAAGQKPAVVIARGSEAAANAARIGAASDRERAYIAAVQELYRDAASRDQQGRVLAYRDAMAALAARYPDDSEASIFYALALAQSVPASDKTYTDLLKAGAILEPLFAKYPDHPGLAHYIIHAYDVPPLAPRALAAARRYAQIAPAAPHALHMPSHTFTRLGLWQESIDTNIASAAAAKRDGATAEELHASDYQAYAYLQTGQDAAARRLLDSLPQMAARFDPEAIGSAAPGVAGVFALAAIPARFALERGDWAAAAKLEPHPSRFPQTEAMTYLARGLGAARTGDVTGARAAAQALAQIHERLVAARETYWAEQVEIERRSVVAGAMLAERKRAEALAEIRAAAELEDLTEKNAITPGPIVPARELLAQMLLETGDARGALAEFAATLRKEPGRFRALAGAAKAARAAGDKAAAASYESQLAKSCVRGDQPGRPELAAARKAAR